MSADPTPKIDALRAYRIALVFLIVTAATGALLRAQALWPQAWIDYRQLVHGHSHTAFYGWVFNVVFAFALLHWIEPEQRRRAWWLFALLQVANVGMLLSFPWQGYGPVSISFSTLHLIVSVIWLRQLWRSPRIIAVARLWLRLAILFFFVSAIGPLLLGPLAALDLRVHPAYQLALYWFLHFQYNGWFPLALIAALISREHAPPARADGRACALVAAGVVLTYAQSTLWLTPPSIVYAVAALGALLQLLGFSLLVHTARAPLLATLRRAPLLWLAALAFGLKCLLQLLAATPALGHWVNHPFIALAFLHLVFLGVITIGWISLFHAHNLSARSMHRWFAWWLFLPAFTLSELLIILPVLTTSLPTWIVHNTSIALFILAVVQMLTFCLLLPSREISNRNITTQASECLKG